MQQKKSNMAYRRKSAYRRNKTARRVLSILLSVSIVILVLLLIRAIRPAEWFRSSQSPLPEGSSATAQMPAESETDGESPTAMTSVTTSRQDSEPSVNASDSPETSPPASQSPGNGTAADTETGTESTAATTSEPSSATSADTALRTPGHENMPAFGTVAIKGDLAKLEAKVKSMVSTFPGKYGITFVNLATGERFGVNDTQEYIAASTSKFPMNVLLWKRIAAGEIDPESILVYKKEDFESGTGIIQKDPFGTEYSVRTTSRYSIIHSDNCGINMIIRLLDIVDIRQYLRDLGGVVEYGKTHRSCPADMANVAVDLYRFYYDNPAVAGELIDYLEHTNWNERINGLLPKEVRVAHKIGNQTRTANDVGIVFASEPYVLSVMTENVDFDAACRNIAKLSKMIYDHMEAQP